MVEDNVGDGERFAGLEVSGCGVHRGSRGFAHQIKQ